MSGGKGGEQTTTVDVPQWMEDAARANLAMGQRVAGIGYMPYYGPDVAAFSPMQTAAMQNTANLAAAFGMQAPTDVTAGMPQAQQFAGGLMGYSSQPLFAEATQRLMEERPRQYAQYSGLYPNIEPYGIPSQEALSPVTGGTTARGFGMPSVYTNSERAAEVAQNYADGYMAMGGEESRYRRPSSSRKASATTPTTTLAPTTAAQPAPALTPRTDAEINELINQGLSKYQPTLPDLSGYARLSDIPTPQALPDVSKFATQADINRAIAGIPQPVMPTMEGLVTQEQLNRALAGLSAPVSIPNLGIGGMPQFRF